MTDSPDNGKRDSMDARSAEYDRYNPGEEGLRLARRPCDDQCSSRRCAYRLLLASAATIRTLT